MARRRSSRRNSGRRYGRRKAKAPISISGGLFAGGVAMSNSDMVTNFAGWDKVPWQIAERITGYKDAHLGGPSTGKVSLGYAWDKTLKWAALGMGVKALGPKIPFVKSLPKKIPVVGKYMRW